MSKINHITLVQGLAVTIAELELELGMDPGNAPLYSVHYWALATNGDSEVIELRGMTDPNGQYRLFVPQSSNINVLLFLDPVTGRIGSALPRTTTVVDRFRLSHINDIDSDIDQLGNLAELILGTNINDADTDNDGIEDGAEFAQGTNPLDGLRAATGIINSTDTPGVAIDICAINDIAIVADSDRGATVFFARPGQPPIAISQVDTPGAASAVACSGNLVAVADGNEGLAIIDVTDPPAAFIARQIAPGILGGGASQALTSTGNLAFVGTTTGWVSAIELSTGTRLSRIDLSEAVQDLGIEGDTLYAYTSTKLHVLPLFVGDLYVSGTVDLTGQGNINASNGRGRMFVGGGVAYTVHSRGYNSIDVSNPELPFLITHCNTPQLNWKQMALDGSGHAITAVGSNLLPNPTTDNVYMYNLASPKQCDQFPWMFPTSGIARSISIFNGLAYIADAEAGMQVINYQPYDMFELPPQITLTTNSTNSTIEEGQALRLTATVQDDVQVRNVEFYVDRMRVATDGNFPFEHRFIAPLMSEKAALTVRAMATDTGGNKTWSDEILFMLSPDATPPEIRSFAPKPEDLSPPNSVNAVSVLFSEPIEPSTLTSLSFKVFGPGPDGLVGSPDDTAMPAASVSFNEITNLGLLTFAAPLPANVYHAVVEPLYTDRRGNAGTAFDWYFSTRQQQVAFTTNLTIFCPNESWANYDVVVNGGSLAVECQHSFNSISVVNEGKLRHTAGDLGGLQLNVSQFLSVAKHAAIDLTSLGFGPATGPGAGVSSPGAGGGGYGGAGGSGTSLGGVTYGSVIGPIDLGSGGGNSSSAAALGGRGGGAMRVNVGGVFQVEGALIANGFEGVAIGANHSGGGSGGSIWINTPRLTGDGLISANGGDGLSDAGSGAGGRIAVYAGMSDFAGEITARGGNGPSRGGAGTILVQPSAGRGTIFVDNGGGAPGATTEFSGEQHFDANFVITGNAIVGPPLGNASMHLVIDGDVHVEQSGYIGADRRGFGPASGPGAGSSVASGGAGGAGYGGTGGAGSVPGGGTYGLAEEPSQRGSGGGNSGSASGGRGGGVIRLTVGGELHVDGAISANGGDGLTSGSTRSGGGSGGSVWINASTLGGSGRISADGGNGLNNAGGGGGGRVAIYACEFGQAAPQVSVLGGIGVNSGAPGTEVISLLDVCP